MNRRHYRIKSVNDGSYFVNATSLYLNTHCDFPQEVLARGVLLPLINQLSDPDYINQFVVWMVSADIHLVKKEKQNK